MIIAMAVSSFASSLIFPSATQEIEIGEDRLLLYGPLNYDDEANSISILPQTVEYGEAGVYAIFVLDENGKILHALSNQRDAEKLKIKAQFQQGGEVVYVTALVKSNISGTPDPTPSLNPSHPLWDYVTPGFSLPDYCYAIAVQTKPMPYTTETDIVGTITLNKKATDESNWSMDDVEIDIEMTASYEKNYIENATEYLIDGSNSVCDNLLPDEFYFIKFDRDDEIDFEFGKDNNEGTFTVDVSGQGKIALKFNTTPVDAIEAANGNAQMDFVNFNNVKFNRSGEYSYQMENGKFAYKIVDGKLYPLCEYDEAEDAFVFNTNVLGSYVFADRELVNPQPAAPQA